MLHCVSIFVVRFAPLECTNRTADRSRLFFIAKNCSNKKTLKSCPSTVFSFIGETLFVHFDIDSCCYKERKWNQFVSPLLRRRLGPPCSPFLWLSRSVQVRKHFCKKTKFSHATLITGDQNDIKIDLCVPKVILIFKKTKFKI